MNAMRVCLSWRELKSEDELLEFDPAKANSRPGLVKYSLRPRVFCGEFFLFGSGCFGLRV
jgi:hypothetical protein